MDKGFILKVSPERTDDIKLLMFCFFLNSSQEQWFPGFLNNVLYFLAHVPLRVKSPFYKKQILEESSLTRKGRVAIQRGKSFV